MADGIFNLRPNGTNNAGTGTTVDPSGTRQAVTSDNSDTTFVLFDTEQSGSEAMVLRAENVSIDPGERVVRYRLRIKDRNSNIGIPFEGPAITSTRMNLATWQNPALNQSSPNGMSASIRSTGWIVPASAPSAAVAESRINNATFFCRLQANADSMWWVVELYFDVDIRARPAVTDIELLDAGLVDRCGGTVTDTTAPRLQGTFEYGHSEAPGGPLAYRQQRRIFTAAQVGTSGFDPWVVGPWGDPVDDRANTYNASQQGVTVVFGGTVMGEIPPLENGSYVVYYRVGAPDSIPITGEPWWSATASCAWTQNFALPDPPTLSEVVAACPPSVTLTVGHEESTTTPWDDEDDVRTEVQVSWDAGATWQSVIAADQGVIVPEDDTVDVIDRFVQVTTTGDVCGGEVERPVQYRARLYGTVDGGAPAFTEWTVIGVTPEIVVPACTTSGECLSWIIHPSDPSLDWSGAIDGHPWTQSRPYDSAQPIEGGLPHTISGAPGGRDHSLTVAALSTDDTQDLLATLEAVVVWYIPDDPSLPAVWIAPGPAITVDPAKIPSDEGAIHRLLVPAREVQRPPVLPPVFPEQPETS